MYNNLSNDKGSRAEYVSDDNTQGQLHRTDLGPGYIVLRIFFYKIVGSFTYVACRSLNPLIPYF